MEAVSNLAMEVDEEQLENGERPKQSGNTEQEQSCSTPSTPRPQTPHQLGDSAPSTQCEQMSQQSSNSAPSTQCEQMSQQSGNSSPSTPRPQTPHRSGGSGPCTPRSQKSGNSAPSTPRPQTPHRSSGSNASCTPEVSDQSASSAASPPDQHQQSAEKSPVQTIDLADDSDSDVVCLDDDDEMKDDASYFSNSDDESMAYSNFYDFDWASYPKEYPLYHENPEFKALAKPFIDVLVKDGLGCVEHFQRAHSKMPGVDEFWNFLISKRISRSGWVGLWKVVNPDRKGWPLQYLSKAEVLVKSIRFIGLTSYTTELQNLKAYDPKYEGKSELVEIPLWQIEPLRSFEESNMDLEMIESEKAILKLIRMFYETIFVPPECENDDITSYFGPVFYERLELLFYMENPTPYTGLLSIKDRGKIISGIKQYHCLKNSLMEINIRWLILEDDAEEANEIECSASMRKFILLQMQLDRLKVELNFLMKNSLRPLVDSLPFTCIEDFDSAHILVMKEADIADFNVVHNQLLDFYKDKKPKFRICTNLENVLRNCSAGTNIFVASGNYSISGLHNLAYGGCLIGIKTGANMDVTITPTDDVGDVWLLFSGCSLASSSKLTIKNINFVVDTHVGASYLTTGLYFSSGNVSIEETSFKNVGIAADNRFTIAKKSTNANVNLVNCDFTVSEVI